MESVVWMIVGMFAIVLIPVLVVGTWFVIMTLILGVSDAGIWILGLGSTITRGRKNRPRFIPMPTSEDIDANDKKAPVSTLSTLIPVNRPMTL